MQNGAWAKWQRMGTGCAAPDLAEQGVQSLVCCGVGQGKHPVQKQPEGEWNRYVYAGHGMEGAGYSVPITR